MSQFFFRSINILSILFSRLTISQVENYHHTMTALLSTHSIRSAPSFQTFRTDDSAIPLTDLRRSSIPDINTQYDGSMTITSQLMCPNINCNIAFPHTYSVPVRPPPPPPHVIPVRISRFAIANNPFPTLNCWEITDEPPALLHHGIQVHTNIYGTLMLVSVASCWRQGKEWEVFSGLNPNTGLQRMFVLIPREWVRKPERKKISGIRLLYYHILSFCCGG